MNGRPGAALPSDDVVRDAMSALIDTIPASKDARIVDLREGLDEARSVIDMELQTHKDVGRHLLAVSQMAREEAGWSRSLKDQATVAATVPDAVKKTSAHGPSAMPPFGATLARRATER